LPQQLPDRKEEKKGPRVDAPEQAIDGFLRANGLDNTDALSKREDKKGTFYVLEIDEPGRPLGEALGEFLPDMIAGFQWPKSMRWGDKALRWVRPLRGILCVFDGAVVPFSVDGIASSDVTYGHRFMAPDAIKLVKPADYLPALEKAYVLADAARREEMVQSGASALAQSVGCTLLDDAGLVRETAGLVEWPEPLLGKIDDAFMDVPEEVLISVMRTHQKYFALRNKDGKLAPYFITISNMQTPDKGAAISAGNERVLRARLSDGRFFWDQDRKATLESRLASLEKITFQAKLGTVAEKAKRIAALAEGLAEALGADKAAAQQAGALCKADLTSGMVYEFPELQGIMGGYYAQSDALGDKVAAAIRDHYSPLGPGDAIPETPEGRAVALADKLDTLAGFWSIYEKPTGSKDPYALRRAALGLIRIFLETQTHMSLSDVLSQAFTGYGVKDASDLGGELLGFIADRLKVHLRDQGISHDVVSAIFALGSDDVVELAQRAEKLQSFLASDDGANLKAAFNRAHGICTKANHTGETVDASLLVEPAEMALHQAMGDVAGQPIDSAAAYAAYLDGLATLRAPVDAFFEAVMVNDEDDGVRQNRLSLLQALIALMRGAAAFDLIE
jgi:glycyl-tRNA synthetase beta chain